MKQEIRKLITKTVGQVAQKFLVEAPADKSNGDYSTNVALVLKQNPEDIKNKIFNSQGTSDLFEKIEVKNGFINFFVSKKYLQEQTKKILKEKEKFGDLKIGKNQKINVEFISANPTGPLTLGNGRGGFGGDVLANVLAKAGYKVFREYYINDTGTQIIKLGHSVLGDAEAVYKGEYINELNRKIKGKNAEEVGKEAGKIILDKMIKPSVKKMGIEFDKWFSEETLYKSKKVDKAIQELVKKGFTYEKEGALWFKSKDLGDDKDRVLIRSDKTKTYFASDVAYLKDKIQRGFNKLIIFLGADHYGYVARLKAVCQVLGFNKENVEALVLQLVKLFENGKEVRMSKRTGSYVTMDELIDEAGLDIARFFFLQRSLNTHFNFDMNLAKDKSEKNPVFKIQYAYARINSIFKKTKIKPKVNSQLLKEASELYLIKQLIKFSEVIEDAAKDYQLQRLPNYALELAEDFHKFYEKCQVISEDKNLTEARLALILATKIVLESTLKLMGITSPQKM